MPQPAHTSGGRARVLFISLTLLHLLIGVAFVLAQTPGADGLDDPYFPRLGNGGYDVRHYTLDLTIDPEDGKVSGTVTIEAAATQDLSAFNLDFQSAIIAAVTVDDAAATFTHDDGELTITPAETIAAGELFSAVVTYSGEPGSYPFKQTIADLGWYDLDEAGVAAFGEPAGTSTWYPVNEHPSDKATYTFRLTTTAPNMAITNGELVETITEGDQVTYVYEMRQPMASYLAILAVGNYVALPGETTSDGIPVMNYASPMLASAAVRAFQPTTEIVETFSDLFGPYPFDTVGGIAVEATFGFALETQGLPVYDALIILSPRSVTEEFVVHELAHQWFGNSVSPKAWDDIWLNEGFATYSEWLWREQQDGREVYDETAATYYGYLRGGTDVLTGDPGPDDLFDGAAVYTRGALTLHALRLTIGDDAFFETLRTYYERYQHSVAETADFIAVAESVSGMDLDDFFQGWLFEEDLPALPS